MDDSPQGGWPAGHSFHSSNPGSVSVDWERTGRRLLVYAVRRLAWLGQPNPAVAEELAMEAIARALSDDVSDGGGSGPTLDDRLRSAVNGLAANWARRKEHAVVQVVAPDRFDTLPRPTPDLEARLDARRGLSYVDRAVRHRLGERGDRIALTMFELLINGVDGPREQQARIGCSEPELRNATRRLRRAIEAARGAWEISGGQVEAVGTSGSPGHARS